MTKRNLIIFLLVIVAAFTAFMAFKVVTSVKREKELQAHLKTLPPFTLQPVGEPKTLIIDLKGNRNLLLVSFNSECDFCQHEAADIVSHIEEFTGVLIVFVSSEPAEHLKSFDLKFGLSKNHIVVAQINESILKQELGVVAIPHLFLYSNGNELIREFRGETKVAAIINAFHDYEH